MKQFAWSAEKSAKLMLERGVSFERIVVLLEREGPLDVVEYPNQARYPGQRMFIMEVDGYAYLVPFVEDEREIFLKTIIPSRKATKRYLEHDDEH